jgi:hypothetical protein
MLSILIPIYNQDVRPLVYTLSKQCNRLGIVYQILCFDDGSIDKVKEKNKELAFKFNINYTEMTENLGRSRIRNWLGKAAYHEHILFLDCDSVVKDKNFIKNYIDHLPAEGIISGGRLYAKKPPTQKKKILHWLYGSKRESLPAQERNRDPYLNFHSNNFLMPMQMFPQFLFDEAIDDYGYEDLVYAEQLKRRGIPILHIDNPVVHDGLEIHSTFLSKTRKATETLALLHQDGRLSETRLSRTHHVLKKWRLIGLFRSIYSKMESNIEANLVSENPSLYRLQMWKLNIYDQKTKK